MSTVDAAGRPRTARWWWEPQSRTAIIESAEVVDAETGPRTQRDDLLVVHAAREEVRSEFRAVLVKEGGEVSGPGHCEASRTAARGR